MYLFKTLVPKTAKKIKKTSPLMRRKLTISDFRNIALKDYAYKKIGPISETDQYCEFLFNKRIVVQRTSLCWLLNSDITKMSNDRLFRVRATNRKKKSNYKPKKKRALKPSSRNRLCKY